MRYKYGVIKVLRITDASMNNAFVSDWSNKKKRSYTKYSIKETDFRVKTATFTSPEFFDLTMGQLAITIESDYHENFVGFILDVEYDEKTGLYTYQCQDWSRRYMDKFESILTNCKLYNILRYLISNRNVSATKPTKKQLEENKKLLSGLRKIGLYDQSLYEGNIYKNNPFKQTMSIIMRDKTPIEVIRSLVHKSLGTFDVYFDDSGLLQIEPLSKTDWESTGLVLSDGGYYDRKFKFSTTNAITTVYVTNSGLKAGDKVTLDKINGMNLSVFFGNIGASVSNPATATTTANKSKAVKSSKKTTTTTTTAKNKYNNPFNNKPKKAWINADSGSDGMKNALAKALQKAGWKVHVGRTWSNAHYVDYWNVTKDYSTYLTIYNGFCAGTIREAYSSTIQNVLKKKGVQLVVIFDTATWNNARGMKPYKYGDFTGANIGKAWDDNFSSGNPGINDVASFFKKNKAKYCASPTASGIMKQYNAGGYFASKGIKV